MARKDKSKKSAPPATDEVKGYQPRHFKSIVWLDEMQFDYWQVRFPGETRSSPCLRILSEILDGYLARTFTFVEQNDIGQAWGNLTSMRMMIETSSYNFTNEFVKIWLDKLVDTTASAIFCLRYRCTRENGTEKEAYAVADKALADFLAVVA